jgi:hypothetical protein
VVVPVALTVRGDVQQLGPGALVRKARN